jgi:hypothetical protein
MRECTCTKLGDELDKNHRVHTDPHDSNTEASMYEIPGK